MDENRDKIGLPYLRLATLAIGVMVFDRITKMIVVNSMGLGDSTCIVGNFFCITLVKNPGGAFGTRFGGNFFYIGAAVLAAIMLVFWLFHKSHRTYGLAGIALMLGGAAGNLWDRLTAGKVVDFLDFGIGKTRWPTFNIADSAITLGILLLILQEFLSVRQQAKDISIQRCDEQHRNRQSDNSDESHQ